MYIRYAHKVEKLTIDLGIARNRTEIASKASAVTILDKGTGAFTLHFIFYDGTELTLNNTELTSGDTFRWDIEHLLLTNTAQTGVTLKLLVEYQVQGK